MDHGLSEVLGGEDLARFHLGDETLLVEVIDVYSPRLQTLVRSFARQPADARDLLQETWRQICLKRTSYSGTGPLLSWCYAVCRNVCLTATRRRHLRFEPLFDGDLDRLPTSPWLRPDTLAQNAALRRDVSRALRRLPRRERAVLVLRLVEQRSTRETAETLSCAEGTVKATLHHAVKKMQVAMKAWEG